jgi:predicted signal transduction protein with EAL and GGDEF domain
LVRSHDTIARLGGDEFAIVATNVSERSDIAALCTRVVQCIREPFELNAGQAFVGASIGVAIAASDSADGVELTRQADIALYAAKEGGRNRYEMFEERMNEQVQRRQVIEADLRSALVAEDQLKVVYDPLMRQDETDLLGVEAKLTWNHPELGDIGSETFLPIAESCGLIEAIGEIMLYDACRVGAQSPSHLMAVRIFSAQLRNPAFFDKLFSIIEVFGMRPGDLELEIGEKMLASTDEAAVTNLRKLRQAGIRIALRDFGTGFTSLRLLQQFQVDRIKIDRSFIAELAQSPDPEAITHAVIWLARAIGVEVSADGVDSVEQKEFLARMGCMRFQGELFSSAGQANWLKMASQAKPVKQKTKPNPKDDIEMWDTAS